MANLSINLHSKAFTIPPRTRKVGEFHDYIINKGLSCPYTRGLATENINTCTAGALITETSENKKGKAFVFHIAPELQDLYHLENGIEKQVNILRETCDKIHGFICGGREVDINDFESIKSFDLFNTTADIFDKLGIKFSMICGKHREAPMENMYTKGKEIHVWSDGLKKSKIKDNPTQEDIVNMLKKKYQIVEINDEHELKLIG